ncbi:glycoside hydrolase family 9 protein [Psychromonas ossibalaenae]|uniref:glycoside hydrolase family 9 protein n=1 Tax=Psychromonas ossibalaenae TaxID=444922 RepID=UPI00037AFF97|nr:glycoside hydrolase family 9 protein [Psychromonas ossibalaenae]
MELLSNHIGYERFGAKQAVLQTETFLELPAVKLVSAENGEVIKHLPILSSGSVDQWSHRYFYLVDFSDFQLSGSYFLRCGDSTSHTFLIAENILMHSSFSDVLHYFKSQRCTGTFDQHDKQAPVLGSDKKVDVHGGWYDASGDMSKYFSHLSYANYMNPQQIPMIVWNMFKGLDLLQDSPDFATHSKIRLQEEAVFGADFLLRMFSEEGYFYLTVFDKWSKDPKQRDICAYEKQSGNKTDDYQAAFRQGAGMAIAALARASRSPEGGEYDAQQYLNCAETAYWHLKTYNCNYCDDAVENIIDEYCALIAAVELFSTTELDKYLQEARYWAAQLSRRQQSDASHNHFWSANADGSRPYFHGAEAGLPVIALCQYLEIETDLQQRELYQQILINALNFELSISSEVFNPFSYPRQYVKSVNGEKRSAFFIAHDNESGYWWQGENARLASLACMAYFAKPWVNDAEITAQLDKFAQGSLNWILGLNPYDMCMLDGAGFNNPDYLPELGFFNAKGGVCNGITGGFENENDIAFNPPVHGRDMLQNWRWGEQWIPHAGWYLLAVTAQYADQQEV